MAKRNAPNGMNPLALLQVSVVRVPSSLSPAPPPDPSLATAQVIAALIPPPAPPPAFVPAPPPLPPAFPPTSPMMPPFLPPAPPPVPPILGPAPQANFVGTEGNDVINGNSADNKILAGSGNDTVNGGDGNDVVDGQVGNDTLKGGNGHDRLFGSEGDDSLEGNNGNDTLDGGSGRNTLDGGSGDDLLFFSLNDSVAGGPGADTFVLANLGPGQVVLTDFQAGEGDRLDLSDYASLLFENFNVDAEGDIWIVSEKQGIFTEITGTAFTSVVEAIRSGTLVGLSEPYFDWLLGEGPIG